MRNKEAVVKLLNNETLRKLVKYGIIGSTSFIIDFSVTYYLKEILLLDKMLANSCGFCMGACQNFLFNKFWSFKSDNNIYREFIVFIMIAVVGLTLNSLIILFFNGVLNLNFYLCKIIAVGMVFFWNFSMNYKFNFKSSEKFIVVDEEEEQSVL